jgi:hypothetical protein
LIKKERFLEWLTELKYVEESFITMLTTFNMAVVNQSDDIGTEKQAKIKKILSKLKADSTRHRETINLLIEKVTVGEKDEY